MKVNQILLTGALTAALGLFIAVSATAQPAPPAPTPVPPDSTERAPVLYHRTGGPYIAEQEALATADRLAESAITRRAVGLVNYAQAMAWIGSGVGTIDPQREVYLVVNQAKYIGRRGLEDLTCHWYFAVVDATDGKVRSVGCTDRTANWPRLPSGVNEKR